MRSAQTLAVLKSGMSKLPQVLVNVRLPGKQDVMKNPAVKQAVQDAERKLGSRGRVLLRPSGTEPVVRVMAEGNDQRLVEEVVATLARAVSDAVGAQISQSCAA